MKTFIKFQIVFLIICQDIYAQLNTGQSPKSFLIGNIKSAAPFKYSIDVNQILRDNPSRNDSALLVAVPIRVEKDFMREATLIYSDESSNIYQMSFKSENAISLGIYFSEFRLPEGYELYAYDKTQSEVIGAFTHSNNHISGKFSISPRTGDELILELYEPKNHINKPSIIVKKLAHYFREDITNIDGQNCYTDVHCLTHEGTERAIFLWTFEDTSDNNFYNCSGSLLNQDVTPNQVRAYAYTANHCGGEDADLTTAIFRFHFQNNNCNITTFPPNYTMVGGTLRATKSLSDMF